MSLGEPCARAGQILFVTPGDRLAVAVSLCGRFLRARGQSDAPKTYLERARREEG